MIGYPQKRKDGKPVDYGRGHKCFICNEWMGHHSEDEAMDHSQKWFDYIQKDQKFRKKHSILEYFKNIPPIKKKGWKYSFSEDGTSVDDWNAAARLNFSS